jgi:hypothetical protein
MAEEQAMLCSASLTARHLNVYHGTGATLNNVITQHLALTQYHINPSKVLVTVPVSIIYAFSSKIGNLPWTGGSLFVCLKFLYYMPLQTNCLRPILMLHDCHSPRAFLKEEVMDKYVFMVLHYMQVAAELTTFLDLSIQGESFSLMLFPTIHAISDKLGQANGQWSCCCDSITLMITT